MKILTVLIVVAAVSLAGCATNSSVPGATGLGAGAGALLGYGLTGKGTGAAAGAGAGALAGALTGAVIDSTRRPQYQAPPPPPPQGTYYQSVPPAPRAYTAYADPTRGEFLNNTRWRVEVYVNGAGMPLVLGSRQSYPVSLDIGYHRIVARAFVPTMQGERLVGTYAHTIYIDSRSSGWSLRFDEFMF